MLLRSTFVKYLSSYLFAFLIPIIVLAFIVFKYFMGFYSNELVEKNLDSLNKVKANIDMQIYQLNTNAIQMSGYVEFSTSYILEHPSAFYDIGKTLQGIKFTNSFIHNLYYFNKKLQNIYAHDAVYTFDSFDIYGTDYENYTGDDIKALFNNVNKSTWLPEQNVSTGIRMLTYMVPVNWHSDFVYSMAIYQIDSSTLDSLIGSAFPGREASMVILDSQNDILYSSNNKAYSLPEDFWTSLDKKNDKDFIESTIDGEEVLVSHAISDNLGLTYVTIIPIELMMNRVNTLKNIFISGTFIILIIGSIFITIMMHYNYNPLHQLSQFAKNILPTLPLGLNEVDTARRALASLSERNENLTSAKQELMRENLILKLLRGGFKNVESFNTDGTELGLHISGTYFRAVVFNFSMNTSQDENNYTAIIPYIEKSFKPNFNSFAVEYPESDSIILILSGDLKDSHVLDNNISIVKTCIYNNFFNKFIIGVGNAYTSLSEVNKSYLEASITSKCIPPEDTNVVYYNNLTQYKTEKYTYPNDELTALHNAIEFGDVTRAEFVMDVLTMIVRMENNLLFASCLCYGIINTVIKAMNCLKQPHTHFNEKYANIIFKIKFNSVDEIVDLIKELSREIIDHINKNPYKAAESNVAKIISYIDEHYMECGFCVNVLADHFGMSASNISHYFKSHAGQNISDYVNSLRLQRAKELLKDTNLSVSKIVQMVGYVETSSFMRKFKQIEKKTPGEYRQMVRPLNTEDL